MKSRLLLAGVVAVSLSVLANPVLAKQCVWNKAGFILDVTWTHNGQFVRRDRIPTAQGTCSDDNVQYGVILSIVGGQVADAFTRGALVGAVSLLGSVVPGTGTTAAAAGASTVLQRFIPDPKNIIYSGIPGSHRYLDVWGTIWNPQTGPGGPIR
jgi:hypothetical protein